MALYSDKTTRTRPPLPVPRIRLCPLSTERSRFRELTSVHTTSKRIRNSTTGERGAEVTSPALRPPRAPRPARRARARRRARRVLRPAMAAPAPAPAFMSSTEQTSATWAPAGRHRRGLRGDRLTLGNHHTHTHTPVAMTDPRSRGPYPVAHDTRLPPHTHVTAKRCAGLAIGEPAQALHGAPKGSDRF